MAGRAGEAPLAGDQRSLELFGKGNVRCVVSRQIVSKIPDAEQQGIVRIAVQRKIREISECRLATLAVDFAPRRLSADRVRNLDVEQMRRVQRLTGVKRPPFDR